MVGVLLALALLEAAVLHVLAIAICGWRVAAIVGAIEAGLVALLIWLLLSLRRFPVLIGEDRVIFRVGGLKRIDIPFADIAGLESDWPAERLRREAVTFALLSYPNIIVVLRRPIRTRRGEKYAVAHRLDDPAAFTAALTHRLA
jgi:hypothetical protein